MTAKTTATLSRNPQLVLDVLRDCAKPLSAYEILDQLKSAGLRSPLQIYRALTALRQRGYAHRLESLNAFIACADPDCCAAGVHAFAICDLCGQVTELGDAALAGQVEALSVASGFVSSQTVIEVRGSCQICSSEPGIRHACESCPS